ncbi:MAG: hypothetical protein R6V20_10540, partial [Desulfobia sp.]
LVGVLGAGVVSMLSTSSFQGVRANHGERAYYLAESGYRYALSVYRDESGNKVDALESLNGRNVTIPGGGSFTLKSVTVLYDENNPCLFTIDGNQTVGEGDDLQIVPEPGVELEQYNNAFAIKDKKYRYLEYDDGQSSLKNIQALSPDTEDTDLHFRDGDNATAVESLRLVSRGEFPGPGTPFNVAREVSYWQPLPSPEAAGGGGGVSEFNPDNFPGGQKPEYHITPVAQNDFNLGSQGPNAKSTVDTRTYIHPRGGTYQRTDLRITGYDVLGSGNNEVRYYYVPFKHSSAGLGLQWARDTNDDLLSYDVQIKTATGPWLKYASTGFMFRAREQGSGNNSYYRGYGISFMRYSNSQDYIPDGIKPADGNDNSLENRLLLVLWEQTGQTGWQWLAYKILHTLNQGGMSDIWNLRTTGPPLYDTFVKGSQYNADGYFIHDDTTLMIRVIEKMIRGERSNDIQLFFGDARWASDTQEGRSQDQIAYNVENLRFGYEQRFASPGEDLWRWPSLPDISAANWNPEANDWFTAVAWDRINPARPEAELISDREDINSVIRDKAHTSAGFTNNQQDWPEIVIHTFGHTSPDYYVPGQGPVHFRDLAVRLLQGQGGGGGGLDYVSPIQQ